MATVVCGCTAATALDNSTYIIELSSGRTLQEMINGIYSLIPNSLALYPANDISVPSDVRASDRDLAIHCNDLALLQCLSVCYFDTVNDTWIGPVQPATTVLDEEKQWLIWPGFLDVVIPFKSRIQLMLAGHIVPVAPGQTTHLGIQQPACEHNLSLRLSIYNDKELTQLNTTIDTATAHTDYPVSVAVDGVFVAFPETGVTSESAGNVVDVDLTKLEYENIVYVNFVWWDLVDEITVTSSIITFPAPFINDSSSVVSLSSRVEAVEDQLMGLTTRIDTIEDSLTGPKELRPVNVTGGTVCLDSTHNAYRIAPATATNITIDSSLYADSVGAEFYLVIDMSAGVQTVTFPANFSFVGGTAPAMSKKGYYLVRATYSALGEGGFFGEYIGVTQDPKDFTHGIWYWTNEGALDTNVFEGQQYVNHASIEGGTLLVNSDSAMGMVSVSSLNDTTAVDNTCIVHGTIATLSLEIDNSGGFISNCLVDVDGGVVESLSGCKYSSDRVSVLLRAGTIGSFTFSDNYDYQPDNMTVTVHDGYAKLLAINCAAISILGGTVDVINPSGYSAVTVSGGLVNTIDQAVYEVEGIEYTFSGGTVNTAFIGACQALVTATAYVGSVHAGGTGDTTTFRQLGGTIGSFTKNLEYNPEWLSASFLGGTLITPLDFTDIDYQLTWGQNIYIPRWYITASYSPFESTIAGGTVACIDSANHEEISINVSGGTVYTINPNSNNMVNISGGIVNEVFAERYAGQVVVSATADVASVTLGDDEGPDEIGTFLYVSGGLVRRVISAYTFFHNPEEEGYTTKAGVHVSGGTVGISKLLADQIAAGYVAFKMTGGTVVYLQE